MRAVPPRTAMQCITVGTLQVQELEVSISFHKALAMGLAVQGRLDVQEVTCHRVSS
jgi:hypothetical protein